MAGESRVGLIYVELDLDTSKFMRSQQQLLKDATSTSLNIEENFNKLGIKSDATFNLMRQQAVNAFERITAASSAGSADMIRAQEALAARMKGISSEQTAFKLAQIEKENTANSQYWNARLAQEKAALAKSNQANAEYWQAKMAYEKQAAAQSKQQTDALWGTMGIRSTASIEAEKQSVLQSYATLSAAAKGNHQELINLERAKNEKLKALNAEMVGHHEMSMAAMTRAVLRFYAAFYVLTELGSVVKTFIDAGIAAQQMAKGLEAAMGSAKEANSAYVFLRQESERLGLVFVDQVKGYTQLTAAARGTSLEGEQTRKIFTAITTASTALGLSSDQTSGALMAVQQMMSKGNVQAEELRGQLGERLPGAFNMAAEAMGVTTVQLNKMLKDGDVLAVDLLPKLADVLINRYGSAATEAADLTQAAINRMDTAYNDFKIAIIDNFLPAITGAVKAVTNLLRLFPNMSKAMDMAKAGLIDYSDIIFANGDELNKLVQGVDPLVLKVKLLQKEIDNLKTNVQNPISGWMLEDELADAEKKMRTLEYQMSGVTKETGQWAQGAVKLNEALNAQFSKGDSWIKFKEQKDAAYDRGSRDELTAAIEAGTKADKTADDARKNAIKSADEYNKSLEKANEEYSKLALSEDEFKKAQIWAHWEKQAAKMSDVALAARDMALAQVDLDRQAKLLKADNEYLTRQYKEMSDAEKQRIADTKAAKKAAAEEGQALRSMYKDMGEAAEGYYDAERQLLDENYAKYDLIVHNKDALNKWYASEKKKIDDAETLRSDDFFGGMKIGYEELQKDAMTWAKGGQKLIKDFASEGSKTMSDVFFKTLTGEMVDLNEAWTALWQSMLKTMLDIISQMLVNDLLKLLFGGFGTGGGLNINVNGQGTGAPGAASSALSLYGAYKWIESGNAAMDLSAAFGGLTNAAYWVTDALGVTSVAADSAAVAAGFLKTSTAVAGASLDALAKTTTVVATTTGEAGAAAGATSTMATLTEFAPYMVGVAAAMWISFGGINDLLGGNKNINYDQLLRQDEAAGGTLLDEETRQWYKSMELMFTDLYHNGTELIADTDEFMKNHQALVKMSMAEIDYLRANTEQFFKASMEAANTLSGFDYNFDSEATVEFAVDIANDASLSLEKKMYELGFVATASGSWESEATMAMIAEFKDQGVPWSEINTALTDYGMADTDVYKRIYAEYNDQNYLGLGTWADMEAALYAEGVSADVIKTVKATYDGDMPWEALEQFLYGQGIDSATITNIIGTVDPSSEWTDLVIPVDAPESIPLEIPDMYGRAAGGPVGAGSPYIIGEKGPELFVPQTSGHILSNSNMKMLMGMGVRGYADGTTDPLPGTSEWWEAHPPSDSDVTPKSSNPFASLEEWTSAYAKELEKMLGLDSAVADELAKINDYYEEQIKYANELGASAETLAQMELDQLAAQQKVANDLGKEYADYYNDMMGNTSDLDKAIADVNSKYDEYIKDARALGAAEEDLNTLYEDQAEIIAKLQSEAITALMDDMTSYYSDTMGLSTDLGNKLDANAAYWEDAIKRAEELGATEEELNAIRLAEAQTNAKITEDYKKSLADDYQSKVNNWLGVEADPFQEINDWFLAEYNMLVKLGLMTDEIFAKMLKDWEDVTAKTKKDLEDVNKKINESINTNPGENPFYKAFYDFQDYLETGIAELKDLIKTIDDTMFDLKYSKYNPFATVSRMAQTSQGDYERLLKAAQGGDPTAVKEYLAFIDTYLAANQNRYKSSEMYQQIFTQVMADMEKVKKSATTVMSKEEELLKQLNAGQVSSIEQLTAMRKSLDDIKKALYSGTSSQSLGAASYQPSVLGGQSYSSVPASGGQSDPEVKELLKALVIGQSKSTRVEIRLDSGRTLTGEMRAVADGVYVERGTRPTMSGRRIYQ